MWIGRGVSDAAQLKTRRRMTDDTDAVWEPTRQELCDWMEGMAQDLIAGGVDIHATIISNMSLSSCATAAGLLMQGLYFVPIPKSRCDPVYLRICEVFVRRGWLGYQWRWEEAVSLLLPAVKDAAFERRQHALALWCAANPW